MDPELKNAVTRLSRLPGWEDKIKDSWHYSILVPMMSLDLSSGLRMNLGSKKGSIYSNPVHKWFEENIANEEDDTELEFIPSWTWEIMNFKKWCTEHLKKKVQDREEDYVGVCYYFLRESDAQLFILTWADFCPKLAKLK